jgi:uncharacterized protein YceK
MNFIKILAIGLTAMFFMSGCAQVAKHVAPDVEVEGVSSGVLHFSILLHNLDSF